MKDEVYIIGGGASLRGFDFNKLNGKDTIAVNKALFYIPNPTYFISMDYMFVRNNKHRIRKKQISKFFVGAISNPYLKYKKGKLTDLKCKISYDLDMIDVLIFSKYDKGLGFDFNNFRHGCNSGYCALQLAIILGYKKIYLLGIDLNFTEKTHFHDGYGYLGKTFERKLQFYYLYFRTAIHTLKMHPNIQVYSCSPISLLNKYLPYKDLKEII